MPVFPVRHFEWQVLRTVKRGKTPPTGRSLRLVPSRRTKDGSFLTDLVEQGLLTRVTGTAAAPFEATYALTEKGEHAAEFGECEMPLKAKAVEPEKVAEQPKVERPKPARKGKGVARGK
jgi:hypothetical protein